MRKNRLVFVLMLCVCIILGIVSCQIKENETDVVQPTEIHDITQPQEESNGIKMEIPVSDNKLISEWKLDSSGNFSYIAYIPDGDSIPFFHRGYEFSENRFMYETELDGSTVYGYMDENFIKISYPIFDIPTVFKYDLVKIQDEDKSTIIDSNLEIYQEYYPGFIIKNNMLIETNWNSRIDELPYTIDVGSPEGILIPTKLFLENSPNDEYLVGFTRLENAMSDKILAVTDFIIPPIYEEAKLFYDEVAAVKLDGKWGYINEDGQVVIDFIYDNVNNFSDGAAGVFLFSKADSFGRPRPIQEWAIINLEGEFITPYEFRYVGNFLNGPAIVSYSTMSSGSQTYINSDGSRIFDRVTVTTDLQKYSDNNILIYDIEYYILDSKGEMVAKLDYVRANNFYDGLAAVRPNQKMLWGYIDETGEVCIEVNYVYAGDFSHGYAYVKKDMSDPGYLIDKERNQFLEELNIIGISRFNNDGYAIAYGKGISGDTPTETDGADLNKTSRVETVYYMIHIEEP